MTKPFRLTSYNVLAGAYATGRLFPDVEPGRLGWSTRAPSIVARIAGLRPDVACLQEVEERAWPALEDSLLAVGWRGVFAAKGRARPDGCVLLYRDGALRFVEAKPLYFDDGKTGEGGSGHLALIGTFVSSHGLIRIVGTHLRWQAPIVPVEAHIGYRQASQLLDHCEEMTPSVLTTVVCGDFNVTPQSPVIALFKERGFRDAYEAVPQPTCNANHRVARIDYIFSAAALVATPEPIPVLEGGSVLPSATEPSDHLPITASMVFASPA